MFRVIKMFFYRKYLEWKLQRYLKRVNGCIYDKICEDD